MGPDPRYHCLYSTHYITQYCGHFYKLQYRYIQEWGGLRDSCQFVKSLYTEQHRHVNFKFTRLSIYYQVCVVTIT
jgi:hypothetical protein